MRRLGECDLDALWLLRLQALTESAEAFGSTYEETLDRGKESLLQRIQAGDESFYVGAFAPDLNGMVGFFRERGTKERHKGTLVSLFVAPESRGQGVGKGLVQELIAQASQLEGLEQLHLAVVTSARAACRLYRSMGFQVYGTAPRALRAGAQYWDEDLMVLMLR